MKYVGQERRRSVRCSQSVSSDIVFFSDMIVPDFPRRRRGVVRNFSVLGVSIDVDGVECAEVDGLKAGAVKIGIKMSLIVNSDPVMALGRVNWTKAKQNDEGGYIMGIEFVDITSRCQDALEDYIVKFYIDQHENQ